VAELNHATHARSRTRRAMVGPPRGGLVRAISVAKPRRCEVDHWDVYPSAYDGIKLTI
jgi:hypothetical protein